MPEGKVPGPARYARANTQIRTLRATCFSPPQISHPPFPNQLIHPPIFIYSESVLLYILQHTAGTLPCSSTGLPTDQIKLKDGTTRPATTDNEEKVCFPHRHPLNLLHPPISHLISPDNRLSRETFQISTISSLNRAVRLIINGCSLNNPLRDDRRKQPRYIRPKKQHITLIPISRTACYTMH